MSWLLDGGFVWALVGLTAFLIVFHEHAVRERNRVSRDDPMYSREDRLP